MKVNCIKQITCIACVLLSIACNDNGTADNNGGDTANSARSATDNRGEDFVSDVLEINAEEIAWLREASKKATDPALKTMAAQMMQEHEKMERDLRNYAGNKNLRTDDIDTSATVSLNEKAGNEGDEEWADEVGDRHRQLIRRFQRAQRRIDDTELKDIINRNLPTLRAHLDSVQQLENRLDTRSDNKLNPNYNVDPVIK